MKRSLLLFLFGLFAAVAGAQSLDYVQIGSSGNLYTIIEGQANVIDAKQDINSIVFIHRNNDQKFGGVNGSYRYDVSKDGGATWDVDNGVLTPSANTTDKNGRYPNVALYNPALNTNPDSAFLVYLGAAHDNGDWNAIFHGSAQLDSSDFTETHEVMNNGDVLIPTGFTEGLPGEYWAVDFEYDGTALSGDIIVYKGIFNPVTKTFSVTVHTKLFAPHDASLDGTVQATSANIAFDPSGMNGWIMFLGDITSGAPYNLNPVLFETNDGGATWGAPVEVDLDSLSSLQLEFELETAANNMTTGFDADIVVDMDGNPHIGVVVGYGTDYSILSGNKLAMVDVTYSPRTSNWEAIVLDSVRTFRGTFGSVTEDNRPQASRTEAGDKVFLFWLDSNPDSTGGTNDLPNFKGAAIDVSGQLRTPSFNFTKGDARWDGLAWFASVSPTALVITQDDSTNIPTVFTEMPDTDLDPVNFYYIQNITFDSSQFTQCLWPLITLNGPSAVCIGVDSSYNELGATAESCSGGDITDSIKISGNVNNSIAGDYILTYTVTDASGFSDTAYRTVTVLPAPTADFTYVVDDMKVIFSASSDIPIDSYFWDFGDQNTATSSSPQHTYSFPGSYTVCLTVTSNCSGSSDTCKTITGVNIDEILPQSSVNIHPNPSTGIINIEMAENTGDATVEVYNLIGELVEVKAVDKVSAKETIQLDLSSKSNGVYFVKVKVEDGVITKKVVISNQ